MEPKIWFAGFSRSYEQSVIVVITFVTLDGWHYMLVELGALSVDQHHDQLYHRFVVAEEIVHTSVCML